MNKFLLIIAASVLAVTIILGGRSGSSAPATSAAPSAAAGSSGVEGSSFSGDVLNITLKDIADANTSEKAFSRHKNWGYICTVSSDNDEIAVKATNIYSINAYCEKERNFFYSEFLDLDGTSSYNNYVLNTVKNQYSIPSNMITGHKLLTNFYALPNDKIQLIYDDLKAKMEKLSPFVYSDYEKLESATDNGDGTISVKSAFDISYVTEIKNLPDEWKNAKLEATYLLNKSDLELLEVKNCVVTDSKTYDYNLYSMVYDAEESDKFKEISALAGSFENEPPKNPRTTTVVYDPGTSKERSYSITKDKSFLIRPIIDEGYKIYNDPEGKDDLIDYFSENDLTIYAIAN